MRRFRLRFLLLLPAAALVMLAAGCPNNPPTGGGTPTSGSGPSAPTTAATGEVKPLAQGKGVLKGKVTLTGKMPDLDKVNSELTDLMKANQNHDRCLSADAPAADKQQQAWRINKDKGNALGNVFVWLRPPEGGYFFQVDMKEPWWSKEVKIDQPFCAFEPHAVVLFPEYYDASSKARKSTGQEFKVHNNAPMSHNTSYEGNPNKITPGNPSIPPGQSITIAAKADYGQPITLKCTIHTWMTGYAWAFDHPYAAVTNENGEYEIKNIPTGTPLKVVVWHEKAGFATKNADKGEPLDALKDGDNTKDFQVEAK
jgi:hypothetical protein